MGRGKRVLKYQFLFSVLLVVVSVTAGMLQTVVVAVLVFILLLTSMSLTWVTYKQNQVQPRSKSLQTLFESDVLPRLHKNCNLAHPDEIPELRVNIMLLRWRGINPWRNDFRTLPWERTLQIEASYTASTARSYGTESKLEWKVNQGVVGAAMNERAQEVWTPPQYANIDPRIHWNLSENQHERTKRLNSILSVPIYLPSDKEKVNPVGVLNLDSTADVTQTMFDKDRIRDEAIYWSNVIGAIVE